MLPRITFYSALAVYVYFVTGVVASHTLPLLQPPLWLVSLISWCFEGPFVAVFGKW